MECFRSFPFRNGSRCVERGSPVAQAKPFRKPFPSHGGFRSQSFLSHSVFAQALPSVVRNHKQFAILIVDKNSLPLIASIHPVVNRSLKLDPKFPRHLEAFSSLTEHIKSLPTPFSSQFG
jgi:hypothetical protein